MDRLKRIVSIWLACVFALTPCAVFAADTIPQPTLSPEATEYDANHPELLQQEQLYAASAILIEAESGDVIFEKDADTVRYPASTTKIMTLMLGILLVDESMLDEVVTVSERAVDVPQDSSTMNLQAGEQITYRDLLYGTMLLSANDGCNVIAQFAGGSIENFVDLMNAKAIELGCTNTHFANPHGYHDDNHYTTARDMAIIARAAMQIDLFREIVGTKSMTIPATNMSRKRSVASTDKLLFPTDNGEDNKYYYPYAIGIKTGQHSQAGYCFVGGAQKDGVTLISVVLYTGYRARWADTIKLMDYGFSQYTCVTPLELYNMNPITIETSGYSLDDPQFGKLVLKCVPVNGTEAAAARIVATNQQITSMSVNLKKYCHITYVRDFYAPIESGQVIGTMTYYPQDGVEVVYNLVASRTIAKRENAPRSLAQIVADVQNDPNPLPPISVELVLEYIVLPIALVFLLLRITIRIYRSKRRRRKRVSKYKRSRRFR